MNWRWNLNTRTEFQIEIMFTLWRWTLTALITRKLFRLQTEQHAKFAHHCVCFCYKATTEFIVEKKAGMILTRPLTTSTHIWFITPLKQLGSIASSMFSWTWKHPTQINFIICVVTWMNLFNDWLTLRVIYCCFYFNGNGSSCWWKILVFVWGMVI